MKKICTKCKIEKDTSEFEPRKGYSFKSSCKKCNNDYALNRRKTPVGLEKLRATALKSMNKNIDKCRERCRLYKKTDRGRKINEKHVKAWHAANRYKSNAQQKLRRAVKAGKIKKESCGRCRSTINIHGHHEDYSRPLNVVWLCPIHHRERHKELRIMI